MPLHDLRTLTPDKIIAVWKINESTEELIILLSPGTIDNNYLEGISNPHKQQQFLASRLLCKMILEKLGHTYQGVDKDSLGKPTLVKCNYHISISHSHDYAAVVIDRFSKVGIDIELIQNKILKIWPKFINNDEFEEDIGKLTTYWCLKEVLYKTYQGKGLDLKTEISIKPFTYSQSGICEGKIEKQDEKAYKIQYSNLENYILAFNL